jgi:hypothetical protein
MDYITQSDPVVALYARGFGEQRYRLRGRTELLMNNRDPNFQKPLFVSEDCTSAKLVVYDGNSRLRENQLPADADMIGFAVVTFDELRGRALERDLELQLIHRDQRMNAELMRARSTISVRARRARHGSRDADSRFAQNVSFIPFRGTEGIFYFFIQWARCDNGYCVYQSYFTSECRSVQHLVFAKAKTRF